MSAYTSFVKAAASQPKASANPYVNVYDGPRVHPGVDVAERFRVWIGACADSALLEVSAYDLRVLLELLRDREDDLELAAEREEAAHAEGAAEADREAREELTELHDAKVAELEAEIEELTERLEVFS